MQPPGAALMSAGGGMSAMELGSQASMRSIPISIAEVTAGGKGG